MKHNLEKRPKLGNYPEEATRRELYDYANAIVAYFEALEDELREKIGALGDTTIRSMHDNVKAKIAAQNRKEAFEEVLGVKA